MAVFLWRNEGPESADSRSGTSGNGSRERPLSVPALQVDISRRGAVGCQSETISILSNSISASIMSSGEWRTNVDGVGSSDYIVYNTT
jgi:hypothetical protein